MKKFTQNQLEQVPKSCGLSFAKLLSADLTERIMLLEQFLIRMQIVHFVKPTRNIR